MGTGRSRPVRRAVVVAASTVALGLTVSSPAEPAATSTVSLSAITARFVPAEFATHYSVRATDLARRTLSYRWTLSLRLVDRAGATSAAAPGSRTGVDRGCNNLGHLTSSAATFVWRHGDASLGGCDHSKMGPSGHQGLVSVVVSDGVWSCRAHYGGTNDGVGPIATCSRLSTNPVTSTAWKCRGPARKLFDNSNGGGVLGGGRPPSFTTHGSTYCVTQLITYHWNGGRGSAPGQIGLGGINGSRVGMWTALGSSGQGGARNVNWTATLPTTPRPVVINGVYSCVDSDRMTWSQDAQTHGTGFCQVYVEKAVPSTGSPGPGTTTTLRATPRCPGTKLKVFATPDTGKPPLAVTFTLCSPRSVQWRIDFGDGQSKAAAGSPPKALSHLYRREGDYRVRLSVLANQSPASASSATTGVMVHQRQLLSLSANPASGAAPLRVDFGLSTSVLNITKWTLDFGDGGHIGGAGAPPANAAHTYARDGRYRATFSVQPGAYALDYTVALLTVGAGTPPILGVSASPTSGSHPLAVTFAVATTIPGTIASWVLKFGDGYQRAGTGRPPSTVSHTYLKKGVFAAYLIVAQQQRYGPVQYVVPRNGLVVRVT